MRQTALRVGAAAAGRVARGLNLNYDEDKRGGVKWGDKDSEFGRVGALPWESTSRANMVIFASWPYRGMGTMTR
jgi:hypothetical protein